jgi:hypothetical protein
VRQQTPLLQQAPPLQQSLFDAATPVDKVNTIMAARAIILAVIFFMINLLNLKF